MANKIYQHDEAAITWASAGGTELLTVQASAGVGLASATGRQGAYHNFGTSARSRLYAARAWIKPGGTRVIGEIVRVYWSTGDGTHYDNDDGTGDILVSALDKLRNVQQIGTIQIDENAAVEMNMPGTLLEVPHQYGAPIFWNATANALSATATDFGFELTPVPDEIQ
jgi:hypothetical protein